MKIVALACLGASVIDAGCPYSAMWIKHGPAKASAMLQAHGQKREVSRRLQIQTRGYGYCEYSGFMGLDCKQLTGADFDDNSAQAACTGTIGKGASCLFYDNPKLAGYCVAGAIGKEEVSGVVIGGMVSNCAAGKMGCETFSGGSFIPVGDCASDSAAQAQDVPTNVPTDLRTGTPEPVDVREGAGMCQYTSPFAGPGCMQYTGSSWNSATAKADCDRAMGGMVVGTLTEGKMCPEKQDADFAGYCFTNRDKSNEFAMVMKTSPMSSTCEAVADACTTWSAGVFAPAGKCAGSANGDLSGKIGRCTMGPGPMGGAHQDGRSPGYDNNCPGTPAAGSKFQWPLRWTAISNTTSLPADPFDKNGNKKEVWHAHGRVYYDLSKNWKRQEWTHREGRQFFDSTPLEAVRSVMVHRGRDMVFVNYFKNNTKSCQKLDLSIIGNMRPDWFLDGRGQGSSSQYLGNQHINYLGKPTLVKQWRKKDFAAMYFVMSMAGEPDKDGIHWPLILDLPGEGFGEDALNTFYDHKLLPDSDEEDERIFWPDKGMNCVQDTNSMSGPPSTDDMDAMHIRSNLNVAEAGWVALEYSAAPGEAVPTINELQVASLKDPTPCDEGKGQTANMKTEAIGDFGEISYCKASSGDIEIHTSYLGSEAAWTSIGFRTPSAPDMCTMLPAEAAMAIPEGNSVKMGLSDLPKSLKNFGSNGIDFLDSMQPLLENSEVSTATYEYSNGKTRFHLSRMIKGDPDVVRLTWAVGNSATFTYHRARGCVDLTNIPACGEPSTAAPAPAPAPAPAAMFAPACGDDAAEDSRCHPLFCSGKHALWSKTNCPATCCKHAQKGNKCDSFQNVAAGCGATYPLGYCFDDMYDSWMVKNCARFCCESSSAF